MLDNVTGKIPRNKKWSRKEAISNYRAKSFWKLDKVHISWSIQVFYYNITIRLGCFRLSVYACCATTMTKQWPPFLDIFLQDRAASRNPRWLHFLCNWLVHWSFSIICYFLPNPSRILPALMEKCKIKIAASGDWTHNLLIITLMLCWLS